MKFITAVLLFLLTIQTAGAQARIEKSETDTPFDGVIYDCVDGLLSKPLPEPVAFMGSIHSRVQNMVNDKFQIIDVHLAGKGTAVGLVTKSEYGFTLEESLRSRLDWDRPELRETVGMKFTSNFNVPGLYKVHNTYHVEFGKDLALKLRVAETRVNCQTIDFPR